MIDYRLKTFLTLCKVLNYTKTAEILHITQPAVSQHIKYLEDSYGVKLFNYTNKTLELTDAGKTLYDFVLAMETSSTRVRFMMSKPKLNQYPIIFGSTLTIGEYTMSKLLAKLIMDFPSLNITMEVGNTKILLEKLREGAIDFALLEGHFDKSEYNSKFFSSESFIGVCGASHRFANKQISFEDIFDERLILREVGSGTRDILEQILYEHNLTMNSFKKITEIGNMSVIKELVKENLGITFLYREAVKRELADGSLKKINLRDFNVKREFNFVFLKDSLHQEEYTNWYKYFLDIKNK